MPRLFAQMLQSQWLVRVCVDTSLHEGLDQLAIFNTVKSHSISSDKHFTCNLFDTDKFIMIAIIIKN